MKLHLIAVFTLYNVLKADFITYYLLQIVDIVLHLLLHLLLTSLDSIFSFVIYWFYNENT